MRLIRVAAPALVGALLLFIAVQTIATGLGDYGESAIQAFRGGLIPAAIGVGLLLAALAIARRSRAGYLLGITVAALMILAGLALIVIEIPYLRDGGLSAAFAGAFIVAAVIWLLLWAGYGLSVRRSRASFATALEPGDRRMGMVLAGLVVFAAGAYLTLGAIDSNAAANQAIDQAQAAALVAGTTIEAHVVDVSVSAGSADSRASQPVEHLTVEIAIYSDTSYRLAAAPRLCLTDLATYRDPGYKPDVYCWGTPDPSETVGAAVGDLTVSPDRRRIRLELDRGASLCPFEAGGWNAELSLTPQLGATPGGGVGAAPELYKISITFEVSGATVSPPDSAGPSCIAATVSP